MPADPKTLCEELIKVDEEDQVVSLLEKAGYWENPEGWRDFGDMENNFSTAGAQQADPVAALVEKLVNAADALLVSKCRVANIDPEGPSAPPSVRHAVAQLIQQSAHPENETNGLIENMPAQERTGLAKNITLAATGQKRQPSITIVDEGEGQTPDRVPSTFMSLNKSNKLRVPFVQGRFNMGGTGALRFCGNRRIQLIVTRRNPDILDSEDDDDDSWSFTIVRRETPTSGERNSVYRYLAPVNAGSERQGGVLRFRADKLYVKPDGNCAYAKPLKFGSLVKLFEYKFSNTSNILLSGGLLRQVDVRLPSPALPMMFHECRDYGGHKGSFANPSTGLSVRLADNRAGNLADGFPYDEMVTVEGQEFTIRFFGFKEGKAKTYLSKSEGVLFVVNGQTQGVLPSRFYTRKDIKFGYISDSLLTIVDCSKIDQRAHEELFMNTRESLAESEFRQKVEATLQRKIGESSALKEFNHQRRVEKIKERVKDDRPLGDLLKSVVRDSPSLSALFLSGNRLTDPTAAAPASVKDSFTGKEFPTYFCFHRQRPGDTLSRKCEQGREIRILFDTDAENSYFGRAKEKGRYSVTAFDSDGEDTIIPNHSMSLYNGTATLRMKLPESQIGDVFTIRIEVTDGNRIDPFLNQLKVDVIPFVDRNSSPRIRETADSLSPGLSIPNVKVVRRDDWESHGFDKYSALKVIQSDMAPDPSRRNFDFFVNVDNIYLRKEMEKAQETTSLLEEQFKIGLVLIGLALIHEAGEDTEGQVIADHIADSTRAIAMMLIPMIRFLGGLDPEELKA